jgi:predicted RNase H-like HicB family nuclease
MKALCGQRLGQHDPVVFISPSGAPFPRVRRRWEYSEPVRTFNVVIERDPDTGLFVGHVPGWPGAHTQGQTIEELHASLQKVITMLLEDGEPKFESEFVAVQTIRIA